MKGDSASIINLDSVVSPAILASIFGCNVSLIYQSCQQGRLPTPIIEHTYREAIQQYLSYYKKSVELRLTKEANEQEVKLAKVKSDMQFKEDKINAKEALYKKEKEQRSNQEQYDESNEGMPPLIAAKTKQDIRLAIAREQHLWIKAAIERSEYLSLESMIELCEPLLSTIKQTLLSLSHTSDDAEKAVDLVMHTLYQLGVTMVSQSKMDEDNFIKSIMEREIDTTLIDVEAAHEPLL